MKIQGKNSQVFLHSSEKMKEVKDGSTKLLIGASVYLGKGVPWIKYEELYHRVYVVEGRRILRDDGYLVVLQTDQYTGGGLVPRNCYLPPELMERGFSLLDVKVWKRKNADMFQPPFSMIWVFGKTDRVKRPSVKNKKYFQGIWDFPQQREAGGLNAYPTELCRLLVESFTEEGDTIVDCFCGTARLVGVAGRMDRIAFGYEIDESLVPIIRGNLRSKVNEKFGERKFLP